MQRYLRTLAVLICVPVAIASFTSLTSAAENVDIYRVPGRFGGWPANHGAWVWGDEILVGLSAGYHKNNGAGFHAIDHEKGEEHLLARSMDGGKTWKIENPSEKGALIPVGGALHGITPPGLKEKEWQDCPGGIDFTHPDFCLTARMTDTHCGPARFYYSMDRGHNWQGPFRLPLFDQPGIPARTDYIVDDKNTMTMFLTASKADRKEGRPICVRTTDGGKTWKLLSLIGPEPEGYSIMPSSVRLGPNELLTSVRVRDDKKRTIELYRSTDNGKTFQEAGTPVADTGLGNPSSLIVLKDGRLCLTYGVRKPPFRMCAKLSKDGGRTWGEEITLRDDGGCRDIGYPRSVERADGKVVTIYYFNDSEDTDRYVAATIWDPKS